MPETFNEIERRVLGVLMEKSMTQPEYYPMTANALVAGCNQKSNRDPAMDLDEVAVSATLDNLRQRGLIEQVLPAPGARTDRYRHKIEAHFGWGQRERAVMTELLLRGPQTVGELRSRCARMANFENLEIVSNVLETFAQAEPPMVRVLPREPGRSAVRYAHCFYPSEEELTVPAAPPAPAAVARPAAGGAAVTSSADTEVQALRSELEALHGELADLHEEMGEIRSRIEQIESKL